MSSLIQSSARWLANSAGLRVEVLANGAIGRIGCHGATLNLFPGNEVEGGPANLWLRRRDADGVVAVPLLGPLSPLWLLPGAGHQAQGLWQGLSIHLQLRLAATEPAWFWHVQVDNHGADAQTLDLVLVQDIGLSSYAAIRVNEHYVSHYIDFTPLDHADHGWVLAVRQNLAVDDRHPWALVGSLRRGASFATDALQVQGLALRAGDIPHGITHGLPGTRLQHEHALAAIQDEALTLAPGARAALGFFGWMQADHPAASAAADLVRVGATLALPEALAPALGAVPVDAQRAARTLFSTAPMLPMLDLDEADLNALFGPVRRHEEREGDTLLSFFHGEQAHVVLRAKELRVLRPHGHILRSGKALMPDETALTSTAWMAGVFHSMITQGHVSINRFLSTQHSYLGLFRSQGQRVFVHSGGEWQLLGVPSAFEIVPDGCRWIYKHGGGLLELHSGALGEPHALALDIRVHHGQALRLRITHHVAFGGDDGSAPGPALWSATPQGVFVATVPGTDIGRRFPDGGFCLEPAAGATFSRIGGDELLFADGVSRAQPFVCIDAEAAPSFSLRITGRLVPDGSEPAPLAGSLPALRLYPPAASAYAADVQRLADIVPWFTHNALVHYLAPRGLEQYSGGGWGTRDVCQGPLEMLLAHGRTAPVRDLLLRVFAAQRADGDWPQWFMFFERERDHCAADSHGDIVFWPLLALAQYLVASADTDLLDAAVPFCDEPGVATLWQHALRALAVIGARRIAGTQLAAYGHGDWNDALQPADPALRDQLCSTWTVTLHHQVLTTLATALRGSRHDERSAALEAEAALVLADFQRLLVVDGVIAGYALFADTAAAQPTSVLLHPSDRTTGLRYSLLPMMHAILGDMLSPLQAQAHRALIDAHLSGPDGARLFDRPLDYSGGPERIFQRAESSAFFGREIGVMYMHAHLRYAQMLAHLGDAPAFFAALCKAHPIGLRARVPSADLRQANCYFSSSDAAFADRYEASRDYARVAAGSVRLDGGWRIYSSGPGIAVSLVMRHFIGLDCESAVLVVDPVIPSELDGLRARLELCGHEVEVEYRIGANGCGPVSLALNGHPLPFTRRSNPYRQGAAAVSMATLRAGLVAGPNTLEIELA